MIAVLFLLNLVLVSTISFEAQNLSISYPLFNETHQIFSYSDKISKLGCVSIETALLAGWKYQLLGPSMQFNSLGVRNNDKLLVFGQIARDLPPDTVIFFVDAFDVIFQDNYRATIKMSQHLSNNSNDRVIYSGESNCYPYKRVDGAYHCELMQGAEYLNLWKHRPNNGNF